MNSACFARFTYTTVRAFAGRLGIAPCLGSCVRFGFSPVTPRALILAPDGAAHVLPWSVIFYRAGWTASDGGILRLQEVPALGLLRTVPRVREAKSQPLVVGDPRGDLAGARNEALVVAELLATKALVGPAAIREAIHARLAGAGIVHLATHARFDTHSPLDSELVLADGSESSRDVVAQRLVADLVILSACETGLSRPLAGEELAGLAHAFLYAGAATLMVSLWRVDDPATAELMTRFYSVWRDTGDKTTALKIAMDEVRSDPVHAHTHYWGAFVLLGAP